MKMNANATVEALNNTAEVSVTVWASSLLTASLIVLMLGLPLSAMSCTGALKASLSKEATIIDWVIVVFNFGIIQTCLIGEVATLLQLASHLLGNASVRIACTISHFSKGFGSSTIHFGLTAIVILRFIYVVHSTLGSKINAQLRLYKVLVPASVACVAVVQNLVDYLYNKNSRYGFCVLDSESSLKNMMSTSAMIGALGLFFTLIAADFFLTAAVLYNIRKRKTEVAAVVTEACPRRRQHNLLTIRGTILCRMIALLGYLAFFIIYPLVPDEKDSLRDHFYVTLFQMFISACNTVGLPLVCILQSPYIGKACKRPVCCTLP